MALMHLHTVLNSGRGAEPDYECQPFR